MSLNFKDRLMAAVCASALSFCLPSAVYAAPEPEAEVEEVVVQSTRTARRVQDEPLRVEVIGQEEIEEKALMTPGNISTLVAETGGVRVQVTSPALGAATVRMQGMRGRYTQILADGLPLYGGQSASLGLLQIPPSDLGQVEVIKGAASALYGPSALGGVINLISRRPGAGPVTEMLLNATSRGGQDVTAYVAGPLGGDWAGSVTGGLHRQDRKDLDSDGWLDMPGFRRGTLRPRAFWSGADGARLYATAGVMAETRRGGTRDGRVAPDGQPFAQNQKTARLDAGLVGETPLADVGTLHLRAAAVRQRHDHRFGALLEKDRHDTAFAEASLAGGRDGSNWLIGLAAQRDAYANRAFPGFGYTFTTPAVFGQLERDVTDDLTLAGSLRFDRHSEYGSQLSPRVSMLYRPGPWTVRASVGRGFYAPTPFVEEIEAAGFSRLQPLGRLKAETAETASLEGGWKSGPVELNLTLFGSHVHDAVRLETVSPTQVRLANTPGVTRTKGAEVLGRWRRDGITVTGSYVYVDASEPDPDGPGRRATPLTPRQTAGLVVMWEEHDRGRLGLEVYYTGRQRLDDNPYRTRSAPYLEVGFLAEAVVSETTRVFVNFENILDVRQTKRHPALLPRRSPAGAWTVDAWAPTDGFVVNGGVRLRFGG